MGVSENTGRAGVAERKLEGWILPGSHVPPTGTSASLRCRTAARRGISGEKESEEGQKVAATVVVVVVRGCAASGGAGSFHFEGRGGGILSCYALDRLPTSTALLLLPFIFHPPPQPPTTPSASARAQ